MDKEEKGLAFTLIVGMTLMIVATAQCTGTSCESTEKEHYMQQCMGLKFTPKECKEGWHK